MPANDPAALSPEERALRIAALLATALRRLLVRSTSMSRPKNLPNLSPNGLEFSAEPRLSGQAG
jgi:hypothetical protein